MAKPCYIDGKLYTITVSKEAYLAVKKRHAQFALEEKYIRAWEAASELILRGFESIEKINGEKPESQAEVLPPPTTTEQTIDEIQKQPNKEPEEKTTFKGQHELYTIEQASSYLGINRQIIEDGRRNNELYAVKIGHRFFYKRKDLDKWFDKYLETKRVTGKINETA